jgi:hypothetical protein
MSLHLPAGKEDGQTVRDPEQAVQGTMHEQHRTGEGAQAYEEGGQYHGLIDDLIYS